MGSSYGCLMIGLFMFISCSDVQQPTDSTPQIVREKVWVTSSMDGTEQPSYLIQPPGFDPKGSPVPLVVVLHSWSADLEQRQQALEQEVADRGWLYVFPNFRGPNDHPEALGSELAQQDILDAVQWVRDQYPIDPNRIYLTGSSGGGHMTMLMVGRHPDLWAAASAWVGISDLKAWYATHETGKYSEMMRQSLGGSPGTSSAVDRAYEQRSPLTHMAGAFSVPLDLAAGRHDGHTGSVPVRHTLDAFNVIAGVVGADRISDAEIQQISRADGTLDAPRASDVVADASFGREIFLRRRADRVRVTIFEGGHEGLATAVVAWFERHVKLE
jgi:poly(3-hydroxybutyrate) depolymerase